MLVLSRKKNESIMIGDHITLTVLSVSGERARIGIEAPINVRVMRSELLHTQENNDATAIHSDRNYATPQRALRSSRITKNTHDSDLP